MRVRLTLGFGITRTSRPDSSDRRRIKGSGSRSDFAPLFSGEVGEEIFTKRFDDELY